jgi:hypothetical protein
MSIFLVFLLANLVALGGAAVTSQEQFTRIGEDGSPYNLKYNFERAYLEAPTSRYCPSGSKAFFFVHISKKGAVERVRGHLVGLSADLRSVALKWAGGLLKQLHFRPLMYGTKPSSVDMALTLVCSDGLDQVQSLARTAAKHP